MNTFLKQEDFSEKDRQFFHKNKYVFIDDFLEEKVAKTCQHEILQQPINVWDRYNNPFEQKNTFRDKNNLPPNLEKLFLFLTSPDFVSKLSSFTELPLQNDPDKLFWGIHTFEHGDKLEIHVDAGLQMNNMLIKAVTFGIYLSHNWEEKNGGHLEFWNGDNSCIEKPRIYGMIDKILPKFNRCIIFESNNVSWHGNPEPCVCLNGEKRIFLTVSYLMEGPHSSFLNTRRKALFVKRPEDPDDPEKDKLRLLRANPQTCQEVYNTRRDLSNKL